MAGTRIPNPAPARPATAPAHRQDPAARPVRARPDPNPMRLMLGIFGLASASALVAAMAPSVAPAPVEASAVELAVAPGTADGGTAPVTPVRHITRYVTLEPGQTPPPGAAVQAQPQPTPIVKVKVVTRSRQSGKP